MGKTSLVRAVLEQPPNRMPGIFVDAERHRDGAELYAAIALEARKHDRLWSRIKGQVQRLVNVNLQSVEVDAGPLKVELQAALGPSWREEAQQLIASLAAAGPLVIAIDELPLLLDRLFASEPAEAELLLGTLRSDAQEQPSIRWVMSGSIGLDAVLEQRGLTSRMTYLHPFHLGPWDADTTTRAATALLRHHGLAVDDQAARAVHACLGLGVPYHVQLLVDETRKDRRTAGSSRVTAGDVKRVYDSPGFATSCKAHLLHLESRLRGVLGEGDELRLAIELLTEAAVSRVLSSQAVETLAVEAVEEPARRRDAVRRVLRVLEHDLYVEQQGAERRFTSRLMRDWWKARYETGYVPAEQR